MSDKIENKTDETEEQSFADLFESYSSEMTDDIRVGDQITGTIISIGANTVFLDTGSKVDGAVEKAELLDKDGNLPYEEGDSIELYVVQAGESEIRLSKAMSGAGGLNMLKAAFESRIPVEGKVVQTIKGGFQVEVTHQRAFCPISQIDLAYVETPEDYVGKTFQFTIRQFAENGRNIVVSRRDLLQKELEKSRDAFLKEMNLEDVYSGKVVRIMPFGAFVEIAPGVDGLVHISELGWSRVENCEEAVSVGDTLDVKVLSVEEEKGKKKISLSAKQVTSDPWSTAGDRFHFGDKVKGRVVRCMGFGAFVEIAPGIEGLVHISEMSYTKRIIRPEEVVNPGDEVFVMVKEIDLLKKRIGLSIKDAEGDPWADLENKYTIGQPVQGTVEKKEGFGLFVNLEPGITGLLPKSKINASEKAGVIDHLKPGAAITVTIDTINTGDRKISLGTGDVSDNENWRQFSKSSSGDLGDLGEKLKLALSKNKK